MWLGPGAILLHLTLHKNTRLRGNSRLAFDLWIEPELGFLLLAFLILETK